MASDVRGPKYFCVTAKWCDFMSGRLYVQIPFCPDRLLSAYISRPYLAPQGVGSNIAFQNVPSVIWCQFCNAINSQSKDIGGVVGLYFKNIRLKRGTL